MKQLTTEHVERIRKDAATGTLNTIIKVMYDLTDWDFWCIVSGLAYPEAPGPRQEDKALLFFSTHLKRGKETGTRFAEVWEREAAKQVAAKDTPLVAAYKLAKLRRAYRTQRSTAAQRKIGWQFDYVGWLRFWVESGRLAKRGIARGGYVMSRFKDKGPYSPTNCEIILNADNVRQKQVKERRAKTIAKRPKGWVRADNHKHLRRGVHPRGRVVISPEGVEYPSAAAAADDNNVTRAAIAYRCRNNYGGWRYKS